MFGFTKDLPHEKYLEFLNRHGQEYADSYLKNMDVSYHANVSRITNSIISQIISNEEMDEPAIFDLASGPEMLRTYADEDLQNDIFSTDINKHHFTNLKFNERTNFVSSVLDLPLPAKIADVANMSLAIHNMPYLPGKANFERLRALFEMIEILKIGGVGVITFDYSLKWRDFESLKEMLEILGVEILEDYTGEVIDGNFKVNVLAFRKSEEPEIDEENISERFNSIKDLCSDLGDGLKFVESKERRKIKKGIINNFSLNGTIYEVVHNEYDKSLIKEIGEFKKDFQNMLTAHKSLDNFGESEMKSKKMLKIKMGKKWKVYRRSEINNSFVELV
jgi:hypothetical protein